MIFVTIFKDEITSLFGQAGRILTAATCPRDKTAQKTPIINQLMRQFRCAKGPVHENKMSRMNIPFSTIFKHGVTSIFEQ